MSPASLNTTHPTAANKNLSIQFLEINNMSNQVLQLNARTSNITTTKPWAKTINPYSSYTQTALSVSNPSQQGTVSLTPTLYNPNNQQLAACNIEASLNDTTGNRQASIDQKNGNISCSIDKLITKNGMNVVINVESIG